MTKKSKASTLAHFLYEVGTLRKVIRAHRQTLLTDDLSDNIASHSFRVAIIGWFLAREAKADAYKTLLMCLFHDMAEARSGDQHWVNKRYVKVFEEEIHNEQLGSLPNGKELLTISGEYQKRETLEAKLAKDADLIDQVLLLREYEHGGNKEATSWLKGAEQGKRLQTKYGKKIIKEILKQKPTAWWQNLWTSNRR